jgi:hypothetical protein
LRPARALNRFLNVLTAVFFSVFILVIVRGVRFEPLGVFERTEEICELLTVLTERLPFLGLFRDFQCLGVESRLCRALQSSPNLQVPFFQWGQITRLPLGVLGVAGAEDFPFPLPFPRGDRPVAPGSS